MDWTEIILNVIAATFVYHYGRLTQRQDYKRKQENR